MENEGQSLAPSKKELKSTLLALPTPETHRLAKQTFLAWRCF
jgi:hypothetical protein